MHEVYCAQFALPVCIGVIQPASPLMTTAGTSPFQACLVNQCTEINRCWNPSWKETSKNVKRYHRKRHLFRNQLYITFLVASYMLQ